MRAQPVDAGGVAAEWTWFDQPDPVGGPVILVLHGGGFVLCSIATHRILAARLARACGGRSLVVGYRLAPEHPFPAALDDCLVAYRWLLDTGTGAGRIVLFGDSAGGNLCLAVALRLRDAGLPMPAGLMLASPLTDLTASGPSLVANRELDPFARLDDIERFAQLYLQGADRRQAEVSPLFAELAGIGPLLIQVGSQETLLDDSRRLAARAEAAGVETELTVIDGAFHTWLNYAGRLPEADDALDQMSGWVAQVLARRRA